jgi:hypothetical protein
VVPAQEPLEAVSVCPTTAVPLIEGAADDEGASGAGAFETVALTLAVTLCPLPGVW